MVVSLEMILPGVAGYWVDLQLGTRLLFLVVGLAVGCTGGIWHLLRMTKVQTAGDRNRRELSDGDQ